MHALRDADEARNSDMAGANTRGGRAGSAKERCNALTGISWCAEEHCDAGAGISGRGKERCGAAGGYRGCTRSHVSVF